jgi:hypothetical protein
MWIRRVEFQLMTPVGMFWRHAHPLTAALLTQFKDFGESNRELYGRACKWLDRDLCVYRPDIYENNFAPKRFQTSRPQLLILYLEEDIKKINRAFSELQEKQMKEMTSNESDSGENNFTAEALEGD